MASLDTIAKERPWSSATSWKCMSRASRSLGACTRWFRSITILMSIPSSIET